MRTIRVETKIRAPVERCFDLARSIDLHVRSAEQTDERAVDGVTSGLIGPGDTVTWEARHFGIRQRLKSRITRFDPPRSFQDTMVEGAFQFFEHDHIFESAGSEDSSMTDIVRFGAPCGALGRLAEILLLSKHLETFLRRRALAIKRIAESEEWRQYLKPAR